jgi:hypothetical protein
MHAYKIIRTAEIEAYVTLVSAGVVLSIIVFLLIRPYVFPIAITGIANSLLVWVFIFLYDISLFSAVLLLLYFLIHSDTRARLCFIVTIDSLHTLHRLGHLERRKCINKYFSWFKVGLRNYNSYIWRELPSHPQIKEIDSYYDIAYLLALTGNDKELKDLERYINEIDNSLREQDFRCFLISLQHLRGKNTEETSIYQLSNLFRTVPSFSRIASESKTIVAVLGVTVTLIAGIIEIMKSLGM